MISTSVNQQPMPSATGPGDRGIDSKEGNEMKKFWMYRAASAVAVVAAVAVASGAGYKF
jgi:hypothetical protein